MQSLCVIFSLSHSFRRLRLFPSLSQLPHRLFLAGFLELQKLPKDTLFSFTRLLFRLEHCQVFSEKRNVLHCRRQIEDLLNKHAYFSGKISTFVMTSSYIIKDVVQVTIWNSVFNRVSVRDRMHSASSCTRKRISPQANGEVRLPRNCPFLYFLVTRWTCASWQMPG